MTKSQINRLGDRIRAGAVGESEVRALDEYRLSFSQALVQVKELLHRSLALEPTSRSKTAMSIRDKLVRERSRLSRIQDIAGCRLVTADMHEQELVVARVRELFEQNRTDDRRARPSHGYRAVHVIVECSEKAVEIQVRTFLQDRWAQLSEKLADLKGISVKYGGGPDDVRQLLDRASAVIAQFEWIELQLAVARQGGEVEGLPEASEDLHRLETRVQAIKDDLARFFLDAISTLETLSKAP